MNTSITSPRMPGASMNWSLEWRRWAMRSRKKIVLPCLPRPSMVYSSERGLLGMMLQELHVARGHLHVHQKIRAGQREQQRDPPAVEEHRVEVEHARRPVADGDREGVFLVAVDRLADDVGGLVAVEGRVQHLDLVPTSIFGQLPPRWACTVRIT